MGKDSKVQHQSGNKNEDAGKLVNKIQKPAKKFKSISDKSFQKPALSEADFAVCQKQSSIAQTHLMENPKQSATETETIQKNSPIKRLLCVEVLDDDF